LTYLDVCTNELLDADGLPASLKVLRLSSNGIDSLDGFDRLTRLERLQLGDNKLTHGVQLRPLVNLTVVNMSKNSLTIFPALAGALNLKHLDLSQNNLSGVGGCVENLSNLVTLELGGNCIRRLEHLHTLVNLEMLNVQTNFLEAIPQSVVQLTEHSLRKINIAENLLKTYPPVFNKEILDRLHRFHCSHNFFFELPESIVNHKHFLSFHSTIPNQVTEKVFISGFGGAGNRRGLAHLGITHVLNAAFKTDRIYFENDFTYKILDIQDTEDQEILTYFDDSIAFIEEARKNGKVLVHCQAGVSRSATLVIAWLMKMHKKQLKDAIVFLRERRSIIEPNIGFMEQLEKYEKSLVSNY